MYILREFGGLVFGIMGCTVILVSVCDCIVWELCLVTEVYIERIWCVGVCDNGLYCYIG
jgi:hypothetical protein